MKKRIISILLAAVMLLSVCPAAFALESEIEYTNAEQITDIVDTTAFSPEEYVAHLKNISKLRSDADAIQTVCELFLSSIYASRRDEKYDSIMLVDQNVPMDSTLEYIMSQSAFLREVHPLVGYSIISDNISFENFKAVIDSDLCNAKITVHYSYDIVGVFTDTCYSNCEYYLTLGKIKDGWRVLSVKSNSPIEMNESFVYKAFDAHAAAVGIVKKDYATTTQSNIEKLNDISIQEADYQRTNYSVSDAVAYAGKYYNKTNDLFGESKGENCQNFASQCVWAGLLKGVGASGNSTTAFPAVSWDWLDESAPNIWCRNQNSTYYSHYTNNWAWDNVNGFIRLIWESNHTQSGPQGYYWLGLAKACAGDVITVDFEGTRDVTNGDYDHAMFVTRATGEYGSRGVVNLFIAANSSPTSSAYQPLVDYIGLPESYFCTCCIIDGYYYVE